MKEDIKPELISFDCYGTLIDWRKGVLDTLVPLFGEYFLEISEEEIFHLFLMFNAEVVNSEFIYYRSVLRQIMHKFSSALNINLMENDMDCLVESLPNWPLFPDTEKYLKKIQNKYKLALITNSDNDLIEKNLAFLGIRFSYIITSANLKSYKPARENFSTALEVINLPSEKVLHVSQSIFHDIIPCKDLGIKNIWLNRYNDPLPDTDREKPGAEAKDLDELLRLI